jgi:glycosyltransferase involved in cell wall biosynthesis
MAPEIKLNLMRISIALCTYNGAQYLQKQLDSFASQTYPPYELIVCDDGSTDATMALIESFAGKVTFPVRIFKNERNIGSTKNFEKAIGICDGDLIALSDQDDEWYPDKLARMHRLFDELPEALAAFSNADIVDDDSAFDGRKLWRSIGVDFSPGEKVPYVNTGMVSTLFRLDYIATGATMVFRSKLRGQFIPIPGSWPHDAWIAWIAALRDGLAAFPAATIRYRVHGRQQIGVAPPSLVDQLSNARKAAVIFRLMANRLKDLQLYLQQHRDDKQLAKFIPDLNAKIQHLEDRASLTGSVLHRALWVLQSWREYQRYARGLNAMVIDAFIVSGEKSEGEAGQ